MARPIEFKALPHDGRLWRIDWICALHPDPLRETPMVDIAISAGAEKGRERRIAHLSAAAWGHFLLRSEWIDGVRVREKTARMTSSTIALDISCSPVSLVTSFSKRHGVFVVPPTEYPIPPQGAASQLVVIERGDVEEFGDIVIPCTELFRAYFTTFGIVGFLILTGCLIEPPARRLWNPDRSRKDKKRVHLHLGTLVPNKAAQIVARIAYDEPMKVAAERIVADTIAAANGGKSFHLVCQVPIAGRTAWNVRGQQLNTGGWRRFFVYQMLTCSAELPFDTVTSRRNNPGGTKAKHEDKVRPYDGVVKVTKPAPHASIEVFEGADATNSYSPLEVLDCEDGLVTQKARLIALKHIDPYSKGGSLTISSSTSAKKFSSGAMMRGGQNAPITFDFLNDDKGPEDQPGTLSFFEKLLNNLESEGAKMGHLVKVHWTVMPMEWPLRREIAWTRFYTDTGVRPRRVIVARVKVDGSEFTLLEIERRTLTRSQTTLGVVGGLSVPDLYDAFYCIARGSGHVDEDNWRMLQLAPRFPLIRPIHHRAHTSLVYAQRIIARLRNHIDPGTGPVAGSDIANIA